MNILERIRTFIQPEARERRRVALNALGAIKSESAYLTRARQEVARFEHECEIHELPPIFNYWSNTHLRPICESLGFSFPEDFYAKEIVRRAVTGGTTRILSIGAGNCDTEVRIGKLLIERGFADWSMTCLDLTNAMLERGKADAQRESMLDRFAFIHADFNAWQGDGARFDLLIANQCLHHVVELERLFDNVPRWLRPRGALLTADMIGRNGHMRWPEARALVDDFWEELPREYRYNRPLRRQEDRFEDWDCSVEGFEGIRSQDILPLMCERFGFELFLGFGNIIDPFVDRSFGWNFDADATWDREFIDRVHAADEAALDAGTITPCHMFAVATLDRAARLRVWKSRTPERSIRWPEQIHRMGR